MTVLYLVITAGVAFGFGFLLAERRAVKECNAMLAENQRELFKAISDERPARVVDDDEAPRVALH